MKVVKFLVSISPYRVDEYAGVDDAMAEALIASKKAELYVEETPSDDANNTSDDVTDTSTKSSKSKSK